VNRPKQPKQKHSAGEILVCLIALLVAMFMSKYMPFKWGIAKQVEDQKNAATASPVVTVTPDASPEASPVPTPTPAPEDAE